MLSQDDLKQIASKGISEEQIKNQLDEFKTGFPFLRLEAAAGIGHGIMALTDDECKQYEAAWENYKEQGKQIVKFVPASGAASRMFKDLFAFLDADYDVPTTDFEKHFFDGLKRFAFYDALDKACLNNEGKSVCDLIADGNYKAIVANLLESKGLNYGQLPKGLLLFHKYDDGVRTPMEEHLVEGALYASSKGKSRIHFTVSHEHLHLFKSMVEAKLGYYSEKFNVDYDISFSEQKPSTDTIAANPDNTPFRTEDGKLLFRPGGHAKKYGVDYNVTFSEQKPCTDTIAADMNNQPFRDNGKLLFRPGGHGALIENLNDLDADIIFIKNIDNVVPDRLKGDTVLYKQVIAGVLVTIQEKVFEYLNLLETGNYSHEQLESIIRFVQNDLCCRKQDIKHLEDAELVIYLKNKLNRPIRVCGVVKNVGEPGGGPFLTYNHDGTVSLQILESSQIDKSNKEYVEMFTKGTHFNPVDLVCAVKDYKGNAFDLPKYVDKTTGFISSKSKNGKELKALELPGLWNGAMSDWNTVFVEVPLTTFNPVKTVNDLLREQHQ